MPSIANVLIVGGGTGGLALATLLAGGGVSTDVVELSAGGPVKGSGITLQGNALRSLRQLGVWEEVRSSGYAFDTLGLRDPGGHLLVELADARTGGPDLPATVGMERPRLAEILATRARASGAHIEYGTTVERLRSDAEGVDVVLTDGRARRYDLVVGADGVRSSIRAMIGIDTVPEPTGMGIWRVHAPRPTEVIQTDLVYGGSCYIAGYCPTGPDSIYAYLVTDAHERSSFTKEEGPAIMRGLAAGYHGAWDTIRASIDDPERINYTAFESLLVDRPWNRGRVVLIGDAAHACPPTLAQGAAMGLEDALVLAELLLERAEVDDDLWRAFMDRRFERAATVVTESVQLGRWLLDGTPDPDVPGLMGRVITMVTQPA